MAAVYAFLRERLGGNLHDAVGAARFDHIGEQLLQIFAVGVVSDAGSAFSPTIFCTVPTRPQRIPALSKMPFNSMVVVVLPFVPVTPIKVRCFAGQP